VDLRIAAAVDREGVPRDSSVQLTSDQDLVGLSIDYTKDALQGLDLNSPDIDGVANTVRIYPILNDDANRAILETELQAAILHAATTGTDDGIYDSGEGNHGYNPPNATDSLAVGITDDSGPVGGKYITIRLTIKGDLTCDGVSDLNDYLAFQRGVFDFGGWDNGDMTGPTGQPDGYVDLLDFLVLQRTLFSSYAPEPATMCLLALGGVAVLRRRRRRV
jgi:hypothetical protein